MMKHVYVVCVAYILVVFGATLFMTGCAGCEGVALPSVVKSTTIEDGGCSFLLAYHSQGMSMVHHPMCNNPVHDGAYIKDGEYFKFYGRMDSPTCSHCGSAFPSGGGHFHRLNAEGEVVQ